MEPRHQPRCRSSRPQRQWLSHMSTGRDLHPDFGRRPDGHPGPDHRDLVPPEGAGAASTTPPRATACATRSAADTRIEGGRGSGGDMHAIVVDRSACRLYETWDTTESGGPLARRLRGDLVAALERAAPGRLDLRRRRRAADPTPACCATTRSRPAASTTRSGSPPTSDEQPPPVAGPARRRLDQRARPTRRWARGSGCKSSYSLARLRRRRRGTVLTAMKTYGLVLADNGSPWFFQGAQNARWSDALLDQLKQDPGLGVRGGRHLVADGHQRVGRHPVGEPGRTLDLTVPLRRLIIRKPVC